MKFPFPFPTRTKIHNFITVIIYLILHFWLQKLWTFLYKSCTIWIRKNFFLPIIDCWYIEKSSINWSKYTNHLISNLNFSIPTNVRRWKRRVFSTKQAKQVYVCMYICIYGVAAVVNRGMRVQILLPFWIFFFLFLIIIFFTFLKRKNSCGQIVQLFHYKMFSSE